MSIDNLLGPTKTFLDPKNILFSIQNKFLFDPKISISIEESKAFIDVTDALKHKWKVEISGDMFIATSSEWMDGGGGHEVRYDRATGEFSGYGFDY